MRTDAVEETSQLHCITIASDLEEAREVEQQMLDALVACGYDETEVFAVKLSLEEALVNAVRHGNGNDSGKTISASWQVTEKEATFSVEDEGPGFNPDAVPDPTLDENLERPCGRGVMLMRAYMDEVTFNEKGNRVCMTKRK
jgi:serine/threonine-protein kinase RsbW